MKKRNFNYEKPKNYVIADPNKINEDVDLRFVVINMFSKNPIGLLESTPEKFKEITKICNLTFLPNAKKEDIAVISGLFSSREEARMDGFVGDISSGFHSFGRGFSKFSVYKPAK